MKEFMVIPKGFAGLPMEEEFITAAENKKNTQIVIDGRGVFHLSDFLPLPFGADSLKAHGTVTEPGRG